MGKNSTILIAAGLTIVMFLFYVPQNVDKSEINKNTMLTRHIRSQEGVTIKVWVTAYSSDPKETDDTPFITASGERVREGIVATNLLPFGSEIKIPRLFGEQIFVVKDRMHRRKTNFVDIWMPSKALAVDFGIHETEVIILDLPSAPSLALIAP